jgi:hypothetical protein
MRRIARERLETATHRSPDRQRGQGLVEFALVLPIVLMLIAGVIEIGLLGNDAITIGYGSREGARAGSALGKGGVRDCTTGDDPAGVDQAIVAGVQRIIESSGSDVDLSDITQILIFQATSGGAKISDRINTWTYSGADSGPDIDPGPGVSRLDFSPATTTWPACSRQNGATPDILGVEVLYDRELSSPLAAILRGLGLRPVVGLSETTVMTLNPTY